MKSLSNAGVRRVVALCAGVIAFGMGGAGSAVASQVLWVANDGVDGTACGARTKPCRSIRRAMELARDGDTIDVGAGNYGDLNGNGQVDPGEEFSSTNGCTICVDKSVAIYSLHGANVTVITASSSNTVIITASGARFGSKGHGFTVTSGYNSGIIIGDNPSNVIVAGNTVIGTGRTTYYGIGVFSSGSSLRVTDNRSINSQVGFAIQFLRDSVFERNVAQDNVSQGFYLDGTNVRLSGNVAVHSGFGPFPGLTNGVGFFIKGSNLTLEGNTSAGNAGRGWNIGDETGPTTVRSFAHNSMVGNGGPGVVINAASTVQNFQFNNIYGNNGRRPERTGESVTNCGISNESGGTVKATNNFWGSANGPGGDPADNAGPGCDTAGSNTVFKPFATLFQ